LIDNGANGECLFYPIPQARQQVLKYPYLPGADISDGAVTAAAVTALFSQKERRYAQTCAARGRACQSAISHRILEA
jgi:hypothetical protein